MSENGGYSKFDGEATEGRLVGKSNFDGEATEGRLVGKSNLFGESLLRKSALTIVSALMTNINQRGDRNTQKYVDLGYKLLDVNIRQIVFMERDVFDAHFRVRYSHFHSVASTANFDLSTTTSPSTFVYEGRAFEYVVYGRITFVFFEKTDMYFHSIRDSITEFKVDTPHPTKDTLDYMFVQCYKTEWVAMAICLDCSLKVAEERSRRRVVGDSDIYVWMDFGIRHMYPSDIACDMEIYELRDRITTGNLEGKPAVYAPSCWNPKCIYYQDIYRQIHWVFAGSVFGGNVGVLLEFAKRTKDKCLSIIREKRRLMWEVNVWYMVFLDCRDMFELYHGDHNASILRGFG